MTNVKNVIFTHETYMFIMKLFLITRNNNQALTLRIEDTYNV